MTDKAARLEQIARRVRNLKESPLYEYRRENKYLPVIGEGSPDARIVFVGEAPGEKEAQSGRPFVGASGRILDRLLESVGINRSEVFITNIVKDRPPDNRDPRASEIELYSPLLLEQINIIEPRVIVTLGRFAMTFILERFGLAEPGQKISRLHGQVLQAKAPYGDVAVVPLFHPATVLYNSDQKAALEQDFQVLAQFVEARKE